MEEIDLPVDFAAMGEFAGRMIRSAVQALLDGDAQLAESVRAMDDEIDRMNRLAHADLLKLIEEKPNFTQQAMKGILIAKNLERIATTLQYRHRRYLLGARGRRSAPTQHVDGLVSASPCSKKPGPFGARLFVVKCDFRLPQMIKKLCPIHARSLRMSGIGRFLDADNRTQFLHRRRALFQRRVFFRGELDLDDLFQARGAQLARHARCSSR